MPRRRTPARRSTGTTTKSSSGGSSTSDGAANAVSIRITAAGKSREYEVRAGSRLVLRGSYAAKTEVAVTWSVLPHLLSSDMIHLGHYAE